MKIAKFGHVIITPEQIRIEGWLMTREPNDPAEATNEQLTTAVAADWALKKLAGAVQHESIKALLESSKRIKAALDGN